MRRVLLAIALSCGLPLFASANQAHQPYAGQQDRPISSLSDTDVAALKDGQGWGFAKPAELNGYPGPLHLLELASELDLSSGQLKEIRRVFDDMKTEAKALGHGYLAAERALDDLFRSGTASDESLDAALRRAAELRLSLQRVHLRAHLAVTPLLSRHQRHQYQRLRGYGPDGHHGHGRH